MNHAEFINLVKKGQTEFVDIDLDGCYVNEDLRNLVFKDCYIVADFTGANLKNTIFYNCNLKTCIFRYADLTNTVYQNNCLEATDFGFIQYEDFKFVGNTCYSCEFTKEILEDMVYEDSIGFHIFKIHAGWFDVLLVNKSRRIIISASDYLGNDTPKELLHTLSEMCNTDINNQYIERYLCWDEEPGAYIWKIIKHDKNIKITIGVSKKDSYKIPSHNTQVLKNEEILSVEIELEGQFSYLCNEVINAFERIKKAKGLKHYQENWGVFPEDYINILKTASLKIKKHDNA